VVELCTHDLTLARVEETMYRFGRAYPTYWRDDNVGGHCLARAEWLDSKGAVLAAFDYGERARKSPKPHS
jgi:hypothetical protein